MRRVSSIPGAWLALVCLTVALAQAAPDGAPVPTPASPIAYFRELLAMSEAERFAELAKRPEAQRGALLAKIEQYSAMSASDRELRLRATELRYFLLPMMRLSAEEREARMVLVPDDIRELVEGRLVQWSMIPPGFQDQLMENQAALQLFSRMHPDSPANADELIGRLPTARIAGMEEEFARWQALSPVQQGQLLKGFNNFFQLTDAEQERTLSSLSPQERIAMDRTLRQFDALPAAQRAACIRGFQQFVIMPVSERARFLENVDRWQSMSPEDREQWRSVVHQLSQMPPLPPGVEPVLVESPPLPPGFTRPMTAGTN
jgi:hypothetical protein